jgi:tetratricopeptide (TPR) repeat protein
LPAAEAVCGGHGLDPLDVIDRMASLVEKSLVALQPERDRYRMLDTVRHYAQERLMQSDDGGPTQLRHLIHHLDLAETARPALAGPEQASWLSRLDAERENFLSAHAYSARPPGGDRLGLRLMHALRAYWILHGSLTTGLQQAEEILARPDLRSRDEGRCMALFAVGQISHLLGRHEPARAHLAECLAIAREIKSDAIIARTLQPLGGTLRAAGQFDAALACLEEALVRASNQGDPRELALASNSLTMLHRTQNRHEAAWQAAQQTLALARRVSDPYVLGLALLNGAMVAAERGEREMARGMLLDACDGVLQSQSDPLAQSALDVAAGLACAFEDWVAAAAFYGAAESRRESASQRRDPADEAFLMPLIERARTTMDAGMFSDSERGGRAWPRGHDIEQAREWALSALVDRPISRSNPA